MQAARRLAHNHALDYALACARELGRPLVVYEGLRVDYPWASRRLHRFVLEGMQANASRAEALGLHYWPFVETRQGEGRGLLRSLAARACLVVTDDFPAFIVPAQSEALARAVAVPVFAVDSNGVVPLALLGAPVSAAAHLRPRIHKAFAEAWGHRAQARPRIPEAARRPVSAPFETWRAKDVAAFVESFRSTRACRAVPETPGGAPAARARLREFVKRRLPGYAEGRSRPCSPAEGHASGLSPYLHFGHISIEEVVAAVLATTGEWTPAELRLANRGKRRGLLLRRRRRQRVPRRGAHLARRGLSLAPHAARRRLEPGAGAAALGARDAGGPRGRPEALRLHGRRARERPDARPALERRAARAGGDGHHPQLPAHAVGQEGDRVVAAPRPRRTGRSSTSTTSTRSTAATRTPTPASSGASGSSTGPGRRSDRSSGRCATCRARTPPASSGSGPTTPTSRRCRRSRPSARAGPGNNGGTQPVLSPGGPHARTWSLLRSCRARGLKVAGRARLSRPARDAARDGPGVLPDWLREDRELREHSGLLQRSSGSRSRRRTHFSSHGSSSGAGCCWSSGS